MHGEGHRRRCPSCGQSVTHMRDVLGNCELRGPRQITSSNIDRIFDDNGSRFLMIEEKGPEEKIPAGQGRLLRSLSALPGVDVWGVRGTPQELTVSRITPERSIVIFRGDLTAYQQAVGAWYDVVPPSRWDSVLDGLADAPYEPPPWCPPALWEAFDASLTAVLSHRSREQAA